MLSHSLKGILAQFNLEEEKFYNQLVALEAKYTFKKLSILIDQLASQEKKDDIDVELLEPLQQFFNSRWQTIQDSPLAYCYAPHTSTTQLCYFVAQKIAAPLGLLTYQVLMPSIEVANSISMGCWSELPLHCFILSSDKKRYIDVFESLESAKEDGILKHSSFPKSDSPNESDLILDLDECKHIETHSIYTQDYLSAIQNVFEVKTRGPSIGAAVNRLIIQLRAGGERGKRGGTSAKAGENAKEGIKEFYNYFQCIPYLQKKQLLKLSADNLTTCVNFEAAWLSLLTRVALEGKIELDKDELNLYLRKLSAKYPTEQTPCVELIADDIETILHNHQELFSITPEQPEQKTTTLQTLEAYRDDAKKRLQEALKKPDYNIEYRRHREDCYKKMAKKLYFKLDEIIEFFPYITPLDFLDIIFEEVFSRNFLSFIEEHGHHIKTHIQTPHDFCMMLDSKFASHSFEKNLQRLGNAFLQKIFPDFNSLLLIQDKISVFTFSLLLKQLGTDHVKHIFFSGNDFLYVLKQFNRKNRFSILDSLDLDFLKSKISNCTQLLVFLNEISLQDQRKFLQECGGKFLQNLMRTPSDFTKIMSALREHERYHHFECDPSFARRMIPTCYDLSEVLHLISSNDYFNLLHQLGGVYLNDLIRSPEQLDIILRNVSPSNHYTFFMSFVDVVFSQFGNKNTLTLLDRFSGIKDIHKQLLRCYNAIYCERLEVKLDSFCGSFFSKKTKLKIDAARRLDEVFGEEISLGELKEHKEQFKSGTLGKIVARIR